MTEAVVVAVITGIFAVISQLLISRSNTKELYAKLDKQSEIADERLKGEIALVKNDIKSLSQKVEKHNQLVERMYKVEERVSILESKES